MYGFEEFWVVQYYTYFWRGRYKFLKERNLYHFSLSLLNNYVLKVFFYNKDKSSNYVAFYRHLPFIYLYPYLERVCCQCCKIYLRIPMTWIAVMSCNVEFWNDLWSRTLFLFIIISSFLAHVSLTVKFNHILKWDVSF